MGFAPTRTGFESSCWKNRTLCSHKGREKNEWNLEHFVEGLDGLGRAELGAHDAVNRFSELKQNSQKISKWAPSGSE